MKDPNLPEVVRASIDGVINAESAFKLVELEAMAGTWDGEARVVSKHAEKLVQLDNGKKIPPSGWKCEKCDLTQNLWLNLSDGSILCGRKFFDGSGGNDHAVQHFRETGYPLAVKLGTITKEGTADVFSYDEDDMVEDPYLAAHLAHFGINITQMEKTEKSMIELELDLNQRIGEWSTCQELGSALIPVFGPGRTGMINLGNSCYLNSVMQVIFTIPDFVKRFVEESPQILSSCNFQDPAYDFIVQMAKLGFGLCSGKYSEPLPDDQEQKGISPKMFKYLVGRGHPDFSSSKQQDAQEFFLHLINMLERNTRHEVNPADCFKFQVEDRFQCNDTKKVKYTYRTEYCLPLPIPLHMATNQEQVAEYERKKEEMKAKGQPMDSNSIVRPHINFFSCLESFSQPETVDGFYSSAVSKKTTATKTTSLSTFPDYLMIHLKKFSVREDWRVIKLDVSIDMPDVLDLAQIRGHGIQPGEEPLPEITETPPPFKFDDAILAELISMGFHPEACKKALYYTKNQGIHEAVNWLNVHCVDYDFQSDFVPPGTDVSSSDSSFVPDEEGVSFLMEMGFTRQQAIKALKNTDNNLQRAGDWILSHADEIDGDTAPAPFRDGDSKYRLRAFITHMGTSSMMGHYVCHILKDGQWIIYNDNKVALSQNPPKELAYLYLYERVNLSPKW
ncbi:UNVERIFIED_CONTAM: hypothetical protein PYX00_010277 [Menopon gallinae]